MRYIHSPLIYSVCAVTESSDQYDISKDIFGQRLSPASSYFVQYSIHSKNYYYYSVSLHIIVFSDILLKSAYIRAPRAKWLRCVAYNFDSLVWFYDLRCMSLFYQIMAKCQKYNQKSAYIGRN